MEKKTALHEPFHAPLQQTKHMIVFDPSQLNCYINNYTIDKTNYTLKNKGGGVGVLRIPKPNHVLQWFPLSSPERNASNPTPKSGKNTFTLPSKRHHHIHTILANTIIILDNRTFKVTHETFSCSSRHPYRYIYILLLCSLAFFLLTILFRRYRLMTSHKAVRIGCFHKIMQIRNNKAY